MCYLFLLNKINLSENFQRGEISVVIDMPLVDCSQKRCIPLVEIPSTFCKLIIMVKMITIIHKNDAHFFIRIYFIRISRMKFAKLKDYYKNKPEADILKRIVFNNHSLSPNGL